MGDRVLGLARRLRPRHQARCNRHNPPPLSPLNVRPDPLSFGTLEPGVSAKGTLTVRNPGAESITIERIDTSCPCVKISPVPLVVRSNGAATLTVAYDANDDPNFRGGLGINYALILTDGSIAFRGRTDLSVVDSMEKPSSSRAACDAKPVPISSCQ